MSSLPITPPTARAGTALGKSTGSPPGGAGGDFAALLTQTTARTAHAEGPRTRPQETRRDAPSSRRDHGDDAAQAATVAKQQDDAAQAAQQPAAKADDAPSSEQQQPQGDAQGQGDGEQPQPQPKGDPAAAAIAAAQQLTGPAAPAGATPATGAVVGQPGAGEGRPADAQALLAQAADGQAVLDPNAQPADGEQGGKLQIPTELLNGKAQAHAGGHGKDFNKDGAQQHLPPAPTLPPTADAAAAAPSNAATTDSAPTAAAPQATPATTPGVGGTVSQAQPSATPLTQVPTANGSAQLTKASVVQTAERVQELVRIAATRSGQARATLQLKPEALGQVDVHLRTTREGLVATIAAHDQAGLDALQQAGTELRRLLEDRGVQLQSLDLQLNAGADSGFGGQRDAGDAESSRSGAASSYGLGSDDGDEAVDELELSIDPAPLTATSALVDVTA